MRRRLQAASVVGALTVILLWFAGASFALTYFAVAIYVVLLFMLPGYLLSSVVFKDTSCEFRIAASTAVISPLYAVLILIAIAAGAYRDTVSTIMATFTIALGVYFYIRKHQLVANFRKADLTHLKWMGLLFIFCISLMALPASLHDIPYVSGSSLQETRLPIAPGDQYLSYRLEQILLNGANWKGVNFYGIWTVVDRTPLMGLLASFVTSSLHVIPPLAFVWLVPGAAFSWNVFQIVGLFLDAQILLSAYLVLRALLGTTKARFTMPFLAVNPFIIWNTFYTSPKSMAAYFILLAFLLIIEKKHVRAGIMAALGFLSHSYALFYVVGCVYVVVKSSRNIRRRVRPLALFLIPAALVVAPWLAWSSLIYGHNSSFILYPLASSGPASTLGSKAIIAQFASTPWDTFLWVRVVNSFRTLTPWTMALVPAWFIPAGWADRFSFSTIDVLLMISYLFTLPGALSFSMTLPAYIGWINLRKDVIHGLVTIPVTGSILFFGYTNWGLAILMAQPLVPVMIGIGLAVVSKRTALILFVALLAEHVFFIWGHVYPAYLLLTNLHTLSDFLMFAAILAWALITAKLTLATFRAKVTGVKARKIGSSRTTKYPR